MKHYPARTVPAQIGAHQPDEIARTSRRIFWVSLGQSLLCGGVGLVIGLLLRR